MKFLHLSDLHIGKSVNGFSMLNEQRHIFRQIIGHIQTQRPSAVVIAGDVYDRAVPGTEAVRVFDDFLTALASENIAVLLISGNHDSPERLSYANRLLADKQLYICGIFDGEMKKVTLTDEYGEVNFWLLPFIKPAAVREYFADREIESCADALAAIIEAANVDYTARNVFVSHQFFTKAGVTPVRSDSELNSIGGLDAVDASIVVKFDYAALGHLHGAQKVGSEHIRYAGSPLKYSFSECRQIKGITLAELKEKGSLSIAMLPLYPIHDMREIKGELEILISGESLPLNGKDDYLRIILTNEDELVDPMGKIRSVYPNAMSLDFVNSRTSIDIAQINPDADIAFCTSAYDLFNEFFLDVNGFAMSDVQAKTVRELLDTEVLQ